MYIAGAWARAPAPPDTYVFDPSNRDRYGRIDCSSRWARTPGDSCNGIRTTRGRGGDTRSA
jgi:hypothetical protein